MGDLTNREKTRTPWVLLAFGLVVCLAGTFYFLGDIGKFNDDFFYNQRDVTTGEIRSLVLDRPFHVWRPLFQVVVPALHTLLWNHNWAMHAISTCLHAGVCWLLMRLLVRLGVSLRASAAAALIFMLYPAHFEAVYWSCCIPTLMASCIVLGMFHWQAWWLERDRPLKFWQKLLPIGFAGAAFAAASLNEQPAGLLATLPLLGLLIARPAAVTMRVHVRRAIVPPALAGLALIGYIAGHWHFTAHVRRAAVVDDEPAMARFAERLGNVVQKVPDELRLHAFGGGAFEHGMSVLRAHWPLTLVFGIMLIVAAIAMARWWVRGEKNAGGPPLPGLHLRLIGLGIAMFVCGWIPIVVMHDSTTSRLHYPPSIGLAIVLGAVLQMIANPVASKDSEGKERTMLRGLGLAMLLFALAPMLAMHAGIQDAYRKRYQRDMKEMGDLASLAGSHPGQLLFMPMRVDSRVVMTGARHFDAYFAGCWHWEYAAGWLMQQVFKREDVHVTLVAPRTDLPLYARPMDRTQNAILVGRFSRPLPEPKPDRNPGGPGRIVAWEKIVPFTVSAEGEVRLCSPVEIVDASGNVVETFVPPIVAKLEHSWRETSKPVRVQLAPSELTDREHRPLPTRREKKRGGRAESAGPRAE